MSLPETASNVLDVWFEGTSATELGSASGRWFSKDEAFDAMLRERFEKDLESASRGELGKWSSSPRGSLALVVLCDQFSRNVSAGRRALSHARRFVLNKVSTKPAALETSVFRLPPFPSRSRLQPTRRQ